MEQLFLQVLKMSITAGYVVLLVIAARLLLKKAPKIFSYALWSVVLFRLVCPFSFESIFSLIPGLITRGTDTQTISTGMMHAQTPPMHSGSTIANQTVNTTLPASMAGTGTNTLQSWISFGDIVWIIGIFVLISYSLLSVIKLKGKLKSAKPVFRNLYETTDIKTPFILGIIKPKIYLPEGLSENEKAFILKHEETHLKRMDHIIKPLAFLVVCVHWFNPLVWVAFFLMSEDMELSCDESVLKQMGDGIKKDYSSSLLSLAAGRRFVGGYPLAFGENNTRGRIMNILNYKKPRFWVTIAGIIAVAVIVVALMSNPQSEQLTIQDYAEQFVEQEIAAYPSYNIIDSKITKLEKMTSFDHLLSSPVEIWHIEYRLKPAEPVDVMPGGMSTDEGWITEERDMGKPLLVFSHEKSRPKFLGTMLSGEGDFSRPAGQETALRIFLEGKDLLPQETYPGNHMVVKFPLSTGETSQLLLSQPIMQGEGGIWCVERWMDGNGTVYHPLPDTDLTIKAYYQELQKQSEAGNHPDLLDPMRVAIDFIKQGLGQWQVTMDDLVPQYDATAEDFSETPESRYIGFISNFDTETYSKPSFHLDQIEWLTLEDTERLKELNIDPNDLPNGYYIHNPKSYPMGHQVTDQTEYRIIDGTGEANHKLVSLEEFVRHLDQFKDFTPPFWVTTKDGFVTSITEQYVP
ncbi:M56 family metallopeptidase [Dehalobacterium formicoaceticum]|uniref:M56 family metallopeptidase n=1 Tax=Dehalobacterium formicoaceticum TaxID=51515 RepID=A0ABT1XZU8_9FIRM|nr:M56 family metallopeptidase [Dehalobacterium formicoaceticum]MCR6544140.1 M56 family metallopeptidase [Dehalobacterium formicoaceticum]